MEIRTLLTERLGIRHPIIQAPMASCAGGELAAAVTNAGGFGMIGASMDTAETLADKFSEAGRLEEPEISF